MLSTAAVVMRVGSEVVVFMEVAGSEVVSTAEAAMAATMAGQRAIAVETVDSAVPPEDTAMVGMRAPVVASLAEELGWVTVRLAMQP
jgi:hypothetical protein